MDKYQDPVQEEEIIEAKPRDAQIAKQSSELCVEQIFQQEEIKYCSATWERIKEIVATYTPLQGIGEPRYEFADPNGGKLMKDKRVVSSMRGVAKYVIAQIGKKILSGDMNLTRISFPIKSMIAQSALQKNLHSAIFFPLYINKACLTQNLIERLKFVITATIATFHINLSFHKPLNPILGETISGHLQDGTKLYAEQISHHPPISAFFAIGPENSYLYFGNYHYEATARLNSIILKNRGKRTIKFADGQKIEYNFAYETYSGTFFGTTKVETLGKVIYKDQANDIEAHIQFGKIKKKPSDYFEGQIYLKGNPICSIYGTYMGFIEFNNLRYWEHQSYQPFEMIVDEPTLPSDPVYRGDYSNLKCYNIQTAQKEKERLEEQQRKDAKLRVKHAQKMNQ